MIPTVLDVKGAPIPGLRPPGMRVAAMPVPFDAVLQQMFPAGRLGAPRAVAPAAPLGAALGIVAPRPAARPTVPAVVVSRAPAAGAGGRGPSRAARQELAAEIRRVAAAADVEPALSVAVARAESSLDPSARSPDGLSVGTFQVTYATAAEMRRKISAGIVERPPGSDDVALGIGYLRYLDDIFARQARLARNLDTVPIGDPGERRLFAVAAFNAGEGRVARAQARAAAGGGDPTRFADVRPFLPPITQVYVTRVVAYRGEERAATVAA